MILLGRFFITDVIRWGSFWGGLLRRTGQCRHYGLFFFDFTDLDRHFDDSFKVDGEDGQCPLHLHIVNSIRCCPPIAMNVF